MSVGPIRSIGGGGLLAAVRAVVAGPPVAGSGAVAGSRPVAPNIVPPHLVPRQRERYVFVRHHGKQQRLRLLKRMNAKVVVPEQLQPRLEAFVNKQPPAVDREHLRLAVLNEARTLHERTGADFPAVLDTVLTKFETEIQAQLDAAQPGAQS